jgi:hypothetical protein
MSRVRRRLDIPRRDQLTWADKCRLIDRGLLTWAEVSRELHRGAEEVYGHLMAEYLVDDDEERYRPW